MSNEDRPTVAASLHSAQACLRSATAELNQAVAAMDDTPELRDQLGHRVGSIAAAAQAQADVVTSIIMDLPDAPTTAAPDEPAEEGSAAS